MLQTCYYTSGTFVSSSHLCKTQQTVEQIGAQVGSKYVQCPMSFPILKMLFVCHVLEGIFSENAFLGELLNL